MAKHSLLAIAQPVQAAIKTEIKPLEPSALHPHFPRSEFRRPQAVAGQHALMQAAQFIHDHRLHGSAVRLRHTVSHGMRNHGQCLILRMRHHCVDSLLDHIAAEADAVNV